MRLVADDNDGERFGFDLSEALLDRGRADTEFMCEAVVADKVAMPGDAALSAPRPLCDW